MVKAELFLELLMCLFADPACLDGPSELLDGRIGRKVAEIIFALAGRAMYADQPHLLTGEVLRSHIADTLERTIGDAYAKGSKAGGK